jgi:hypothetical protein
MNLGGAVAALAVSATFGLAACGDDGDGDETTSGATAATADLQPIKDYLTEHTQALVDETGTMAELAAEYHELEEASGGDYAAMLEENRDEVEQIIGDAQGAFRRANPAYEEMEGIVAGVPALAEYDVILDAGSSAEDDPRARSRSTSRPTTARSTSSRGTSSSCSKRVSSAPIPNSRPKASSPISTATARSSSARRCPTETSCSLQPRT